MDGKKMRAAVLTEGAAQAVLRRSAARELDSDEEKVMRMRLGATGTRGARLYRHGNRASGLRDRGMDGVAGTA